VLHVSPKQSPVLVNVALWFFGTDLPRGPTDLSGPTAGDDS